MTQYRDGKSVAKTFQEILFLSFALKFILRSPEYTSHVNWFFNEPRAFVFRNDVSAIELDVAGSDPPASVPHV